MKNSLKKIAGGIVSIIVIAVAAFFGYDYLFADDNGYPQLPLEEYYAGAEGLDGEELKNFLTELVSTNVTLVSYADAKVALAEADADPDNPGKVLTIYSRASVRPYGTAPAGIASMSGQTRGLASSASTSTRKTKRATFTT